MAVSADLAARTTHAELQTRWQARAETYKLIGRALRDVAPGHSGHGASAGHEANNVIARIASLPDDTVPDTKMLAAFDKRFTAIDARTADLIETGIRNNTILRRTALPRIDTDSPNPVKPLRERVAPIQSAGDSDLLNLVGMRLRRIHEPPDSAADAARNRAKLFAAIVTETRAPKRDSIRTQTAEGGS